MNIIYALLGFIAFCQLLQVVRMLIVWRNNAIEKQRMQEAYEEYMKEMKKREKNNEKR